MAYQYSKQLRLPFNHVVDRVEHALQAQGFSMLTAMDLGDTMRTELGVKFRNYKIFSAGIPELSYRAISLERHVGVLLPCNVVVQEHENGVIEVSALNLMETLDHNMTTSSLELIASDISNRLRSAIDELQVESNAISFSFN